MPSSCCAMALLLVAALASPVFAHADVAPGAPLSGTFEVNSQSYIGYTGLTVSFNTTQVASVGSNLTISAIVSVDNLTGAEDYVRDYVLFAVLLCNDHSTRASVGSPLPTQRVLYPGATWGPLTLSIPLTRSDTGLSAGQSANASLTLHLVTDVSYEYVAYRTAGYAQVFGQDGTVVEVWSPGGAPQSGANQSVAPYLLLIGSVLLVMAAALPRGHPEAKA